MKQILHTYLTYKIQFTYELPHLKQMFNSYIIMEQYFYRVFVGVFEPKYLRVHLV